MAFSLYPEQEAAIENRPYGQYHHPTDCPVGGLLGRERAEEPGAKTLWFGMRDIAVFVQGSRSVDRSKLFGKCFATFSPRGNECRETYQRALS